MGKLLIVDGNAVLHRAYHAIPPLTTTIGEPINAVHGMVTMLLKIVEDIKPTHIAFAFDRSEPTFRKKEFAAYQSQRAETDDELSSQFQKARDVLSAMKIPFYDKAGFEADDIIGTLANKAVSYWLLAIGGKKQKPNGQKLIAKSQRPKSGIDEVVIATGDRDQLQLVNDKVKVYMPVGGIATGKLFGPQEVVEKMGVPPGQIVDYKGLVGDPSDNYPGVRGIGPKTAITLLQKYGTFPKIYDNLDRVSGNVLEKLKKGEAGGRTSYKLAKIVTEVDFDFNFDDMAGWSMANDSVVMLFRKYGFKTLTQRIAGMIVDSKIDAKKVDLQKLERKLAKEEVEKVTLEIANRLKGKTYAIRGTASMVLQGLDMGVADIDVLTDKKTALYVNKAFKNELFQKVKYSESDKFKSYFGKASIGGVLVEFYGEWQIKKPNGEWSDVYSADKREVIELRGVKIPVTKLDLELKTSAEMGRWNEYHKIKKQVQNKLQESLF